MKTKISALITTYNESHYLKECLYRISFCDEIIVVDLGSTDNCVEIAKGYGAIVLHHDLVPFAEHVRKFAIAHAKNKWVLFTDPDMYFPSDIDSKIDQLINNNPDNLGIIHMPARKYFGNQPILYGTKSNIESRMALINTELVDFSPLVHYQGIKPKEGVLQVGLLLREDEYIAHYWVNTITEAYIKAKRYIPYEPESRHKLKRSLTPKSMLYEFYKAISRELKMGALKSEISRQIFVFNIWYLINTYKAWIPYELSSKAKEKQNG